MADKTSLIIKSVDQDNKATSRSVTDVSKTATNQQLKAFAQALNATSDNTYQGSSRVQTTDLDSSSDKPSREIALWKSDDGGDTYATVQPAMSNADKGKWFDVRYNGNDPAYVNFGENGAQFKAEVYGGDSVEGSTQYAGVSWLLDSTRPFGTGETSNTTVTVYVAETADYAAAELAITITGGN